MDAALKRLTRYESEISSFFGIVVVLAIVGLIIFLLRGTKVPPSISETGFQTTIEEETAKEQAMQGRTYVVKKGQGLWQVAKDAYGDGYKWSELAKANKLESPYVIRTGQILTLPETTQTQTSKLAVKPQVIDTKQAVLTGNATPASSEYVVQKGDSLWKIAVAQYGGDGYSWSKIYSANKKVIGANPGRILVGQKLALPQL